MKKQLVVLHRLSLIYQNLVPSLETEAMCVATLQPPLQLLHPDIAMDGAAPTSLFSDLASMGSDVIESWTQRSRNAGHTMFRNTNQRRRVDAPAAGDEDSTAYVSDAPECFNSDQINWLDNVVTDSVAAGLSSGLSDLAKMFGEKVQERCQALERRVEQVTEDGIVTATKVDNLEVSVHQLVQEVDRLRAESATREADLALIRTAAASSAALEARVEVMSTQINETRSRLDAAPTVHEATSSRSSIASTTSTSPAFETRTSFILMNLLEPIAHGTPQTEAERKERMERCYQKGKDVPLQCGVVETTYSRLPAMPNGKGCNLEFISHAAGQHARSLVLATSSSFGMSGSRKIWFGWS